jgi:two-component system response regulator AtoC
MREVFKAIGRVAATEEPVLIVGESGTGKELVAAALHANSSRAGGPFVRVNCAALPEGLVESELFGHERGAFTGADRRREGRFERAAGGTIFLDEVGELPLPAQAKLLRVLQQREFERVGGNEALRADVRVVSATHARTILRRLEARYGWADLSLAPESLADIERRDWSGNVRQLENVLARAAIAARGRPILPEHLGPEGEDGEPGPPGPEGLLPLRAVLADVERRTIRRALAACGGNRTRTAEALGISRRLLFDKIREYNLLD